MRVGAILNVGWVAAEEGGCKQAHWPLRLKKPVGKMNAKWNSSVNYSVNSIDWASFFVKYL